MRVLVLGDRGMLGRAVVEKLEAGGMSVAVLPGRFTASEIIAFAKDLRRLDPDAVVNCLGVLSAEGAAPDLLFANVDVPHLVAAVLPRAVLVHASSDAVFRPGPQFRHVSEEPDTGDAYGLSKLIGERLVHRRLYVVRASIIGNPGEAGRGLVGWLQTQAQAGVDVVPGFDDWGWNGITVPTWAQIAAHALLGELVPGVHHVSTEAATDKATLIEKLIDRFQLPLRVQRRSGRRDKTRLLAPSVLVPPLDAQLDELTAAPPRG